jgi:cell shape-determining protein MreC
VGSFFDSFSDAAEQAAHIDALQAEVRALANENAALVARLADIGAPADDEAESIRAGVIARPPLAPYDMLIIGAGAMDGVELGALVTAEGGVPVGSVSSVAAHTAQVSLFSSPGRSTEGWAGETRIPLTLFGKGSGAFAAEVPRDAGIIIGDQVFVPGPGALPVGRVKEVETGPSSPSATIRIEPLANVFSITFVAVRPAP